MKGLILLFSIWIFLFVIQTASSLPCKYADGSDCNQYCCSTGSICSNTGGYAFQKCDLNTGNWISSLYSDNNCTFGCDSQGCRYSDNTYCTQSCCSTGDVCSSTGGYAYRKCNVDIGTWGNDFYEDSGCINSCSQTTTSTTTSSICNPDTNAGCPTGKWCDPADKKCKECKPLDWGCSKDFWCCSGKCINGVCASATSTTTTTTSTSTTSPTTTTTTPSGQGCKSVRKTEDTRKQLDIVFVGHGYQNLFSFASDVESHTNTLLSVAPFSDNKNKINVFRVDSLSDLGCYYGCYNTERMICCDEGRVKLLASKCEYDQIIVLVNDDRYGGNGNGLPSGWAISSRTNLYGTVHEFGHSFGALRDEYIVLNYESSIDPNGPNCDDSSCNAWKGISGAECLRGCTHLNWYRPSDCSIMNRLECKYFNSPSESSLRSLIQSSSFSSQYDFDRSEKMYLLDLEYNYGEVKIKNISLVDGFAPTKTIVGSEVFQIEIFSDDGGFLQKFIPFTEIPFDYVEDGILKGGIVKRNSFDFVETVPYFSSAEVIKIVDPQNIDIQKVVVSNFEKDHIALSEGFCKSKKCSVNLLGSCEEGLWIVKNKLGKPLTFPVVENIPKYEIEFFPNDTGRVSVIAVCFEPNLKIVRSSIDVINY